MVKGLEKKMKERTILIVFLKVVTVTARKAPNCRYDIKAVHNPIKTDPDC